MTDRISIHQLSIICIIGTYEGERVHEQEILLDVELEVDLEAAARSDDLSQTVDYGAIAALLRSWARESKFLLIETLAVRACALLLERWSLIDGVAVSVCKPSAIAGAGYAAVRAERRRQG